MPNRVAARLDLDFLSVNFWQKVDIGTEEQCWLWKMSVGSHGYGNAWDGITVRLSHRCAWELSNGRIPSGLTVDHLCRVRRCCNPSHLRLLSNLDNATDNGQSFKTHCPNDHPYDDINTYLDPKGHRRCRECERQRRSVRK